MEIPNLDHVPKISLGYIALLFMSVICGCIASFYSRFASLRLFPKLLAFILTAQGIVAIAKPAFIFPRSPDSVTLDDLHLSLGRSIGITYLSFALLLWPSIRGNDPTPRVSFMWAFTVGLMIKLMARVYHLRKIPTNSSSVYTEQEVCDYAALIVEISWFFLLVWNLVKTESWGGYAASANQVNFHIRLDHVLLFLAGVVALAFPQMLAKNLSAISKPDSNHIMLVHIYAANLVTYALIADRAVNYINGNDKANYLRARFFQAATLTVSIVYYRLTSHLINTHSIIYLILFMVGALVHLAAGYATIKFSNFPIYYRLTGEKNN